LRAEAGLFFQVCRPDAFEGDLDGLRIDMPHEGPDVLNLPAPGAMFAYFTGELDCRPKLTGQRYGFKLAGRQGDQLFAQALQGPVLLFFPGSAFIVRIHFADRPRLQNPLTFCSGGARAFFPPQTGFAQFS
jgi:hypothetical protein